MYLFNCSRFNCSRQCSRLNQVPPLYPPFHCLGTFRGYWAAHWNWKGAQKRFIKTRGAEEEGSRHIHIVIDYTSSPSFTYLLFTEHYSPNIIHRTFIHHPLSTMPIVNEMQRSAVQLVGRRKDKQRLGWTLLKQSALIIGWWWWW